MNEDGHYYPAGETVRQFHLSDGFFRVLMGPFGSGKTTASCIEYLRRASQSPPDRNGVRRSRGAIIRNRISDLEGTTVKSWNELFESRYGKIMGTSTGGGFVAKWQFGMPDKTIVQAEARFFPYDGQGDIKRLLGSEYTFAFLNEVRELPASLMSILPGRLRYPKPALIADGHASPWHGIWGDTNAPDNGHWLHEAFEGEDKNPNWELFRQPAGVIKTVHGWKENPAADNIKNLPRGYYSTATANQPEDVVRVNYANEYGYIKAGKLIVPNFSDHTHVARDRFDADPDIQTIYIGIDFGSTPAAAFGQETLNAQWKIFREEISLDKPGIREFGKHVLLPILRDYASRGHTFVITGDPAGKGTSQTDGEQCFDILDSLGINCEPAYTNAIGHRAEVVDSLCRELSDGRPRFVISPTCRTIIQGFAQKYVYEQINSAENERDKRFRSTPKKDGNAYSHGCDAVQYCIMGSGYGEDFLENKKGKTGPIQYKNRYASN